MNTPGLRDALRDDSPRASASVAGKEGVHPHPEPLDASRHLDRTPEAQSHDAAPTPGTDGRVDLRHDHPRRRENLRLRDELRKVIARFHAADAAPPPRKPARMPRDRGDVICAVDRDDGLQLRVVWQTFRNTPLGPVVGLRLWRRLEGGDWIPERGRGLQLRVHELPGFVAALDVAMGRARRWAGRETERLAAAAAPDAAVRQARGGHRDAEEGREHADPGVVERREEGVTEDHEDERDHDDRDHHHHDEGGDDGA